MSDRAPAGDWNLVRERARVADTIVGAVATGLALLCIAPLFADLAWLAPAFALVVVVAVAGLASRAIALPLPLVPVVEAITIVAMITAMFAVDTAWARLIPTSESWRALGRLTMIGFQDAEVLTVPVPTEPGLVLLAVGGAGLAALAVDSLFVTLRLPLLAGVPIAVVYAGATMLQFGQAPLWSFLPAAAAWLLLLAADQRERIREWGGLSATTRVRGLSSIGRRIGVLAVVGALAVGIWLPARNVSVLPGTGSESGEAVGISPAAIVLDPLVSMRRSITTPTDDEVLRYRTEARSPSYLRVTALEDFDGDTWRPRTGLASGRDRGVPLPGNVLSAIVALDDSNRVRGGESLNYDITVTNLANRHLPLPYPLSAVDDIVGLGDDWSLDPATGVAFSDDAPATGTTYRVAALDPRVQPGQLRDAGAPKGDFWPLLNLPGGMDPDIKATALEVTADAQTLYDKALALQSWFTSDGGFRYSTSVRSGADVDYIAEFLQDRVGYCEQFAGAMAVMARQLGIPSRVVVGFTQGSQMEDGTWQVTVRDAHAWPELWFEGVGWVRFEPTPRSDATVIAPEYAPTRPVGPVVSGDENRGVFDREGFDPVAAAEGPTDTAGTITRLVSLVLVGAALGWALLPMLRRIVRRRMRLHARGYRASVLGAWAEVGATAVDLGQPWSMSATPRQAALRLSRGMPEPAAAAMRRLRISVEEVRYAPPRGDGPMVLSALAERSAAVRGDARAVVRELRRRVRWQTRLAAYCWPSSERRRQRSSMRSMNPDLRGFPEVGAGGGVSSAMAGRTMKAE